MKILYLSKSIIPSRTANSINVMKMCQAFAENGNEVVLLAPRTKSQYEQGVENIFEYYGVKKNFKIKKLWHPDIVGGAIIYTLAIFFYLLFNKNFSLVYGRFLQGCYVATFLKNRVIFESHESIHDMKKLRYFVFKQLVKSKSFEKLTVISQALKNIYLEKKFMNKIKIQVAHDGADEVKDLQNKAKLFGNKENLKVGYVGHLYKGKGMEIIDSIANKFNDDVDFHIIGGTERDISLWKKKIGHKNVYFYGHISHKDVSSYINTLDVCLLPNQKIVRPHGGKDTTVNISGYTSPLKLFEYMSHNKAIIASDFPVIREVLNEKNSILVDCDDIEEWVSSIKKLQDLKNRELISNQALNDFYKYTWKNRGISVLENIKNRILYASKSIMPSRTANSIHVMKMCQAFAENGNEVVLLAPNIQSQYEQGVENIFEYYGVKKNFEIKKLWHPDVTGGAIIYTLGIFFYLIFTKNFNLVYGRFLQGCYVATFLKNRVIFESHESIFDMKKLRYFVFKQLVKSKSFEKLTVISQALKNIYLEKKFMNKIKIQVVHDGADEVKDLQDKAKLFGNKENLKVGYVGHLYKGRGIETIIECAREINDMTFHLVGGLQKDIDYWKKYSKKINLKNVYFYGFVSPREAIKYKNSFDIFLAPYEKKVSVFGSDGSDTSKFMSPLKIFEYMSHNKPMIASDFPVIREVLNEKNSILVDCDDIDGWIGSINKLKILKNREVIANQALNDFYKFSWKKRAFEVV